MGEFPGKSMIMQGISMRIGYLTIVWGWGISMWELPNNPSHMILRPGQNMWSGRPLVLWINRQIGQQLVGKKL